MSTLVTTLRLTCNSVPNLLLRQGFRTLTKESQSGVHCLSSISDYIHHRSCSGSSGPWEPWIKPSKNRKESTKDPVASSKQPRKPHALYDDQHQRNYKPESSHPDDSFPADGIQDCLDHPRSFDQQTALSNHSATSKRETCISNHDMSYDRQMSLSDHWSSHNRQTSTSDHPAPSDRDISVSDHFPSSNRLTSVSDHFSSFDRQLKDAYAADKGRDFSSSTPLSNREIGGSDSFNDSQASPLPSQRKRQHSDILLAKIRECQNSDDVYNIQHCHKEVMGIQHILASLDKLSTFVSDSLEDAAVIRNSNDFRELGHHLFVMSRQLDADETVATLKHLCRLQVPADSRLMQTILQMLRHQVNDLDIRQIIFLEFILKKIRPHTHLTSALITAIPVLLETRLDQRQFPELTFSELSRFLQISVGVTKETVGVIIKELWQRRHEVQDARVALSVAWSLITPSLGIWKANRQSKERAIKDELLYRCLDVIANGIQSLPSKQVNSFFKRLNYVYTHEYYRGCYHEMFLHAYTQYILRQRLQFRPTVAILEKLFKMGYQCDELVEHLTETVVREADEVMVGEFSVLHLLECLAMCTRPLPHLTSALNIIMTSKAPLFTEGKYYRSPLLDMALNLLSVDHHHSKLMDILTNPDTLSMYMSQFPAHHRNQIKLLEVDQALRLRPNQSGGIHNSFLTMGKRLLAKKAPSRSSLTSMLLQVVGDGYLVSGVITEDHVYIDHLLVLDKESRPIPVSPTVESHENTRIEVLSIPPGCIRLAVLDVGSSNTFRPGCQIRGRVKLQQHVLEAAGFKVLLVQQMVLFSIPQDEKLLYLIQELRHVGVTLNDTLQMVTLGSTPEIVR